MLKRLGKWLKRTFYKNPYSDIGYWDYDFNELTCKICGQTYHGVPWTQERSIREVHKCRRD